MVTGERTENARISARTYTFINTDIYTLLMLYSSEP